MLQKSNQSDQDSKIICPLDWIRLMQHPQPNLRVPQRLPRPPEVVLERKPAALREDRAELLLPLVSLPLHKSLSLVELLLRRRRPQQRRWTSTAQALVLVEEAAMALSPSRLQRQQRRQRLHPV
jgi:hypothetical protein